MSDDHEVSLLGAGEIRDLAARHGIRPTKQWGQNFVVDGNTVRLEVRDGVTLSGAECAIIGAATGKTKCFKTHGLERHVSGENHQVGP